MDSLSLIGKLRSMLRQQRLWLQGSQQATSSSPRHEPKRKVEKRDLPDIVALGRTDTEVQCLQVCNWETSSFMEWGDEGWAGVRVHASVCLSVSLSIWQGREFRLFWIWEWFRSPHHWHHLGTAQFSGEDHFCSTWELSLFRVDCF